MSECSLMAKILISYAFVKKKMMRRLSLSPRDLQAIRVKERKFYFLCLLPHGTSCLGQFNLRFKLRNTRFQRVSLKYFLTHHGYLAIWPNKTKEKSK